MKEAAKLENGTYIFGYYVQTPKFFGVVAFDKDGIVTSLEEKPGHPKLKYAVPGLYFYDNTVCKKAKSIKPGDGKYLI